MIRPLIVSFASLAVLTGLAYPALVTLAARVVFPRQATGSLVVVDGQVRGSRMLAQATEDPRFFWCRPSATATFPTHALASGGSCLAVSNPALKELIAQRVKVLQVSDPGNTAPIPQELVTASASGLDPDLSPEGARWQIRRIARARGIPEAGLELLVARAVRVSPFGPARVNVMDLNRALGPVSLAP